MTVSDLIRDLWEPFNPDAPPRDPDPARDGDNGLLVRQAWDQARQSVADVRRATGGRCTPKGAEPRHNPYRRHTKAAQGKR